MTESTPDAFETYPCLVDGRPASIYVNLRFEAEPLDEAAWRYDVIVTFRAAGELGIGTEDEGLALDAMEVTLIERALALGLVYVGRMRHGGTWESTFHGPPDRAAAIRRIADELARGRRVDVHTELDRVWRYYHEVLLPDAERRRWIDDRRIVDVLAAHGDALRTPRPIDHRAHFPTAAARDAFVEAALRAGFLRMPEAEAEATGFAAAVQRVDPVELDHVHDVVMILVDAAAEHGGTYDGWIAGIVS